MRRTILRSIAILMLLSLFIILSSCSKELSTRHQTLQKFKDKVIFISNESNYMSENEYYDALLDLKKVYPKEIGNMELIDITNHEQEILDFEIKSFPAIVVVSKHGRITRVVSGENASRHVITKSVSNAIETNKKSTLTTR
jgi:hypothetical protein